MSVLRLHNDKLEARVDDKTLSTEAKQKDEDQIQELGDLIRDLENKLNELKEESSTRVASAIPVETGLPGPSEPKDISSLIKKNVVRVSNNAASQAKQVQDSENDVLESKSQLSSAHESEPVKQGEKRKNLGDETLVAVEDKKKTKLG